MFGSILGAIAGPIVSGLFADDAADDSISAQQQQQSENLAFSREQAACNEALQREFAQHGIRWRVEDAKRAGLHPMYALTGGGAAFAPNPIVIPGGVDYSPRVKAQADFGAQLGQVLGTFLQSLDKKDEVISQAVASTAALAQHQAMSSTPFPRVYGDLGDEFDVTRWQRFGAVPLGLDNAVDVQQYTPDSRVSSRSSHPGISAAVGRPEAMEVKTPSGLRMLLPQAQTAAEAHESLSESPMEHLRWIQINADHYGDGWVREYLRQYPGAKQLIEAGEYVGGKAADVRDWIAERWQRFKKYNRDRRLPYSPPVKWPYRR